MGTCRPSKKTDSRGHIVREKQKKQQETVGDNDQVIIKRTGVLNSGADPCAFCLPPNKRAQQILRFTDGL